MYKYLMDFIKLDISIRKWIAPYRKWCLWYAPSFLWNTRLGTLGRIPINMNKEISRWDPRDGMFPILSDALDLAFP